MASFFFLSPSSLQKQICQSFPEIPPLAPVPPPPPVSRNSSTMGTTLFFLFSFFKIAFFFCSLVLHSFFSFSLFFVLFAYNPRVEAYCFIPFPPPTSFSMLSLLVPTFYIGPSPSPPRFPPRELNLPASVAPPPLYTN